MAVFRDFTGMETGLQAAGWTPSPGLIFFVRTARRTGQFGLNILKAIAAAGGNYRFDLIPNPGPAVPGAPDLIGKLRFWVRFNAFPSADKHAVGGWTFGDATFILAGLYIDSSPTNEAEIFVSVDAIGFTSIGTVVKNRWYRVEVDTVIHDDTSGSAADDFLRVTVRVHGADVQSGSDQKSPSVSFRITSVAIGSPNVVPVATVDFDYDDIVFEVHDDGIAFSVPVQTVVAPVPVDVIDDPQSIGQTGDRDDLDERPMDLADLDVVSIPANGDQVIIHHRPMCVRGVTAWKVNVVANGTSPTETHAILISGVEFLVTVGPTGTFREATRYADLTEAEFNAQNMGLRNKTGTTLGLNAIIGELLCTRAEALLTSEDAVRGDTIPMTWVEFIDSNDQVHVWGAQDVAAPPAQPTLPVGDAPRTEQEFQEGRVLSFSTIERGLSDFGGQPEDVAFGWTLNDSDREIRKLLRAEATRAFIGRDVLLRVHTIRDRFLEIKPFTLGRGIVERYNPSSNLQFEFEATGAVLRTDRSGRNRDQIPRRRISPTFFGDCPEDNLDGPEPIIYGSLSSFPDESQGAASPAGVTVPLAVANVAAKGVAQSGAAPSGVTAVATLTAGYQHEIITYTGDGTTGRAITGIGFQPDVVMIKARNGGSAIGSAFKTGDYVGLASQDWNGGLIATQGIESFDADGFSVGSDVRVNQSVVVYVVICISKGTEEFFKHGTYVGDGADDRDIVIAAGFQPAYLFVKNETGSAAVYRGLSHSGDESTILASTAQTTDLIQAFNSDGFQVGADTLVNQSTVTFYWFAWKNLNNALDAFMESGSYVGTGGTLIVSSPVLAPLWLMLRPQAAGSGATWKHTSHPTNISCDWGSPADAAARIVDPFPTGTGFTVQFVMSILGVTHHFFLFASASVTLASAGGGGLTPENQDVTRHYRVSAIVGGKETKLSTRVSATTSNTHRSITVTWNVVASATEILLYSSTRQDFRQFAFSQLAGGATSFSDDDVPRNQTREQLANDATGGTRALGLRESVKYLVYARLADGGFSRPGEAILDALLDGDDISSDKTSFAPRHGDRDARVTWDAFADAVGYSIFRWTAFHADDRGWFDQRTDVAATVLSLLDTLVFGRQRPPVLLPSGKPGRPPKARDNAGAVPLIHVGTEVISSVRYQRFLLASHAVKEVQAIFKSRADDAGAGVDADGERPDADTFQQVQDAEIGVSWLIPAKTGWPFADDFRDLTDADGNVRRYTLIYTTEDPVPERVLANVLGIEDIGDGSGMLIERVLQQFKHCAANFLVGNYQSGGWGVTPTFLIDGEEQIDLDSFDEADDQTALRIDGGYVGAGMLGNEGAFTSIRAVLAEFAQSSDVDVGINHV
ncbi:hypothetical protein LCGC14_0519370, partial [marine sediment metagenome]